MCVPVRDGRPDVPPACLEQLHHLADDVTFRIRRRALVLERATQVKSAVIGSLLRLHFLMKFLTHTDRYVDRQTDRHRQIRQETFTGTHVQNKTTTVQLETRQQDERASIT